MPQRPEEVVGFSEPELDTLIYELTGIGIGNQSGPLQDQYVFLTASPLFLLCI